VTAKSTGGNVGIKCK